MAPAQSELMPKAGCSMGRVPMPVTGPDGFSHSHLEKGTHLTIKSQGNPTDPDLESHDLLAPFFCGGTPEEWILFCKNSDCAFEGQNLTSGPSQCQITRNLLEGEALVHFDTRAQTHGTQEKVSWKGSSGSLFFWMCCQCFCTW